MKKIQTNNRLKIKCQGCHDEHLRLRAVTINIGDGKHVFFLCYECRRPKKLKELAESLLTNLNDEAREEVMDTNANI